ncbi:TadE/TadG family type IV pilus assembly protein [Variovorax boronicumulans]|uniref:TadE/TadG family type IV pilus assembly protein n=1 Tax=Variovorax boronicumulans TaxID=436515 RepID=UPI0009F174FD|nr:TadE/TadG family type IV pilus assembly protein [Variovorax boronicumulans]
MTLSSLPSPGSTGRDRQRGVAAIEFAFVFVVLFLVIYALVTFGAAFYVQQIISRAAEDGARAATLLPQPPDPASVKQVVVESLARSLIVPAAESGDLTRRKNWVSNHATITPCSATPGATSCVVTIVYPYTGDARILPWVPLVDASNWIKQLRGSATAALRTS